MMDKLKTGVLVFCSCTLIFLIFMSYGYLQAPTTNTWHLMEMPITPLERGTNVVNNLKSERRNISTGEPPGELLQFEKQNVTKTLAAMRTLLSPFIKDIKQAAEELRASNKKWFEPGYLKFKRVLNAYDGQYFEKVQSLPSVRTILAKADFNSLREVMNMSNYHYGSSDCTTLEKKGIYGKNWGKKAFNDTCTTDVSKYNERLDLNVNFLKIGMPDSFSLQYPQVAYTFMHVISNAIVTDSGDVIVDQTKLLIQRCYQNVGGRYKRGSSLVHKEVFTITQYWGYGFFHFTAENLVRIGPYIDFLRENPHIKVHVLVLNGFIKSWLSALGISSNRLVTGSIRTSLLYKPAGTPCGRPSYISSHLLSMNLRQSFGLTKGPRDTIVVIKRSHLRFFKKHNEIWKMVLNVAGRYGFRVKLFSDKPIPNVTEIKEMFQRAVLILGPHGAGLSNMYLSQPGTIILEGLCNPINLCYRNTAKVLGLRYVGLIFGKNCFDIGPAEIEPYLEYFLQHTKVEKI